MDVIKHRETNQADLMSQKALDKEFAENCETSVDSVIINAREQKNQIKMAGACG